MQIVLLFPGQGSQKPGMGKELAWTFPAAADVFRAMDTALGVELSRLAFEGPEDELTRTLNAQPALLAHGAAVWSVVRERVLPTWWRPPGTRSASSQRTTRPVRSA